MSVKYATKEQILEAEVVEVGNRDVVKISNQLPLFKHNLDLQEQRLIFIVIAQIKMEDEDFKDYKVHILDIEEKAGALQSSREVNKFARTLMSKTFTIEEEGSYITFAWFSSIRKIKGEQAIIVRFDPALKPYLLQLQKNFTKALLSILLKFRHKYTSQIYLLLKSQISKKLDVKVEELADILNAPKSYRKNFTDFWKRVLKPALEEIENVSDLRIKEIKKINYPHSRKIKKIIIAVEKKIEPKQIDEYPFLSSKKAFVNYLRKHYVNKPIIEAPNKNANGKISKWSISERGLIYDMYLAEENVNATRSDEIYEGLYEFAKANQQFADKLAKRK